MRRLTCLIVLLMLAAPFARAGDVAAGSAPADLEARLAALSDLVAAQQRRIEALEARLGDAAAKAEAARNVLARELSQPMMLLVGLGPCPAGFKRIGTRVWLLTRARTSENGRLFDEAGIPYEDQPGVGNNVYRDLDLCFRPANAVKVE